MRVLIWLLLMTDYCARAAVGLDGVNDIIAAPYNINGTGTTPKTISAWIKPTGTPSGTAGIICERIATDSFRGFGLYYATNSTYGTNNIVAYAFFSIATLVRSSSIQSVTHGKWHHVAMSWDGTTNATGIKFYTNGVETGYFVSVNGSGTHIPDTNCTTVIGNRVNTIQAFNGDICEVAIWTNALTSAQISRLANPIRYGPLQVAQSSLIGYWPLDGHRDSMAITAVGSIIDFSKQGNHASPTNSPTGRSEQVLSFP